MWVFQIGRTQATVLHLAVRESGKRCFLPKLLDSVREKGIFGGAPYPTSEKILICCLARKIKHSLLFISGKNREEEPKIKFF